MKHSSTRPESELLDLIAKRRPQWFQGMAVQRPSSSPLYWAAIRQSRWLTVAIILAIHAVLVSVAIYFNATAMIEVLPPVFVGVIAEPEPAPIPVPR